MLKWEDYRDKKFQDAEFKKAYDELEVEYSIMREILKLRGELGISQLQLSSITGISQPDIKNLENAKANPSLAN